MEKKSTNPKLPDLTLINVYGCASIGKTSTLTALYDLAKSSPTFIGNDPYYMTDCDFRAFFEYKGKKVGIMTFGDTLDGGEVEDFLDECINNKCVRIFTASRTRGAVYDTVSGFANKNGYAFIETSPLYMRRPNGYNGSFNILHNTFAQMLESLI
ncbi:MAG: hypothetical protein K2H44_05310 [Muribaculaceae bacterium]|nr:hypothetical protein [Muribaculaceae bacterium]